MPSSSRSIRWAAGAGLVVFALHLAATMSLQVYGMSAASARAREGREAPRLDERLSHAAFNVLTWPESVVERRIHRYDNFLGSFALGSLIWGSAAAGCALVLTRRH